MSSARTLRASTATFVSPLREICTTSSSRSSATTISSHTCQPSVDPVVIIKMLLLGYLYGITSERRLAEEVRLHLGYPWFLGYDFDLPTPDHSVLSKARARFGSSVFEEFFRQSIELCRRAGLLDEGPVYVDSTLMRAHASVDSLTQRAELARPPLSVAEYLQRLGEEGAAPTEAGPPDAEPPAGRTAATGSRSRCGSRLTLSR